MTVGDRPRWQRLEDGSFGIVVSARFCKVMANVITEYARLFTEKYGVGVQAWLMELRDLLASIARAPAYVSSPERNEAGNRHGPSQNYVSTMEAAKRSGLTRRRIQQKAAAGELDGARKVGRTWLIPDRCVVESWTAASSDLRGSGPE